MKFKKIDFDKTYENCEEVVAILAYNNDILYKKMKAASLYNKFSVLIFLGICGWNAYNYIKDRQEEIDKEKEVNVIDILDTDK